MILPKDRDPRFVTIRRGGTLTDTDRRLLARLARHTVPRRASVDRLGPTATEPHGRLVEALSSRRLG